jgi:glycine/D-amino acid oxidase-like deaminating enzyme
MASLPAERSVVILGAGVIGLSTAYYLSTSSQPPANIYVLDSSSNLFQCASGRAAGFIAKDWFDSSLLELGELSFRLHKELADKFDGRRNWGYSGSVALSLNESGGSGMGMRGEDWLFDGQSRRVMVRDTFSSTTNHTWPQWLKKGDGHVLSTADSTAQV